MSDELGAAACLVAALAEAEPASAFIVLLTRASCVGTSTAADAAAESSDASACIMTSKLLHPTASISA